MWAAVKTVSLVTLVALLIWLWAEAEGLRTALLTPRIQFMTASEDMAVRVTDVDWRAEAVRVRLEGPTLAIDEAERLLRSPLQLVPGMGAISADSGEQVVRLAEALREHPELSRIGVTVIDVQPATVTIRVSRLVTQDIPVRADLQGIEVDGEVTVTPATVRVRMPEQAAVALGERGTVGGGAGGGAVATAVIEEGERALLRDDGPQTVRARVVLPEVLATFEPVTVTPPEVRMTLRVRKQTDEVEIAAVPVWIAMPHTEGVDWDVRVEDGLIRNVRVRGPRDQIARVRNREVVPIAFVVLSSDDLEAGEAAGGTASKLAVFAPVPAAMIDGREGGGAIRPDAALLEQVPPLQYSVENRRVMLRIQKRQPSATAPGTGVPATTPVGP